MVYNELFKNMKLPLAFTDEEMHDYFQNMHSGDINARKELISRNIKLVINIVDKEFSNYQFEQEELVSIGIFGLIDAVDSFDESKSAKFSDYASKFIYNKIFNFIEKERKYSNEISLDQLLSTDEDGNELKIVDVLRSNDVDFTLYYENYENQQKYSIIDEVISQLPQTDKEIIIKYFGFMGCERIKETEIAKEFDMTKSSLYRRIKVILKKIKLKLQKRGVVDSTNSINLLSEKNSIMLYKNSDSIIKH